MSKQSHIPTLKADREGCRCQIQTQPYHHSSPWRYSALGRFTKRLSIGAEYLDSHVQQR